MIKISWGRKMGYMWGLVSGLAVAYAVVENQIWLCLLALIPLAGMLVCRRNDTARDGGVAYRLDD